MSKNRVALIVFTTYLFCLLVVACNRSQIYTIGRQEISDGEDMIPFESIGNSIVLQGYLNGRTIRILFDSGGMTLLNSSFARKLGLSVLGKNRNAFDGLSKRDQRKYAQIARLEIGGSQFENFYIGIEDFDQPFFQCNNIDMVLGADLLKDMVCTINFDAKKFMLSNTVNHLGGIDIPFVQNEWYSPMIDVVLNKEDTVAMLVDLGSTHGFDFGMQEFKTNSIDREYPFVLNNRKKSGYSVTEKIIFDRVDTLSFASFVLQNVTTRQSSYLSNRIGNDFWKQFIIAIDWTHNKIVLSRAEMNTYTVKPSSYHLGFEAGNIYIKSISSELRNYNEEILGAKILSMNGEDVSSLSIESYCAYKNSAVLEEDSLAVELELLEGEKMEFVLYR